MAYLLYEALHICMKTRDYQLLQACLPRKRLEHCLNSFVKIRIFFKVHR